MYRRTANLHCNNGVESPYGSLEGLEVTVFVGKDAEAARVYSKADTSVDVLLGRFEPGITLGLRGAICQLNPSLLGNVERGKKPHLLEDMVQ